MANENLIHASDTDFDTIVLESDLPVLVDFYTSWCGPCKTIAPVMEELADDYSGKVKIVKVNVEEAMATGQKYGIMSVPTLLMFKEGRVVDQMMGAASKPKLSELINKHTA